MLRFLYTISDLLSGICAIVSPIAILHWLAKGIHQPGLEPFTNALDPVFTPLNLLVEIFVKMPSLSFEGQSIPITQGILGCILTLGFFIFNFTSESLKATEQRLDVNRQARQQNDRLKQLQQSQKKKQNQAVTDKRYLVHAGYDFPNCAQGGGFLETTYARQGGKMLESQPDALSLEFDSLERAVRYCLNASQEILGYYATLRPMDPQPPFKLGIHAVPTTLNKQEGIALTRKLAGFAGANQVIFSQDVRAVLEAQGIGSDYHYQSAGIYGIETNRSQEVYRLFYEKRTRTL